MDAVVNAFKSVTKSSIKQWSCCQERHEDVGAHFHMALLLNKATRWLCVRVYLENFLGILVNFSGHGGYSTAYNFVLKEDLNVEFSRGHPKKVMKPRTYVASKTKSRQRKVKSRKLSKIEVTDLIISNKLSNRLELLCHDSALKKNGKTELYEFCISRSTKMLVEFIGTIWDAENAEQRMMHQLMKRKDILKNALENRCICEGQWLICAQELLEKKALAKKIFWRL